MPRRFPAGVFDQGSDPDTRFSLANERTFLAWVRTALALLAGAVAVQTPFLEVHRLAQLALSLWLALLSAASLWQGFTRWRRTEVALRTHSDMPGFGGGLLIAAGTAVLILIVAVATVAGY